MAIIEAGASALGALKTAYDLIREVRNSDDVAKLKTVIDELASRLVDARSDVMQMQSDMVALRQRAEAAEAAVEKRVAFQEQAKGFVREAIGNGAFVYRETHPAANQGGAANYCANCFGNEKLSILQPTIIPGVMRCPACRATTGSI